MADQVSSSPSSSCIMASSRSVSPTSKAIKPIADDNETRDEKERGCANELEVVLFYKYVVIPDVDKLVGLQQALCEQLNLMGRVLIGPEGVNGTLSGSKPNMSKYKTTTELQLDALLSKIQWKRSFCSRVPFADLQIKKVKEIVSSGGMGINPATNPGCGGLHLSPRSFHHALAGSDQTDTVLIDVRNRWEYALGHFKTDKLVALDPDTKTYAEFKRWVDNKANEFKDKRVMMYCTGGIRCETASAYLKKSGVSDVYQLHGGIHQYLQHYGANGYFKGKNFVFDQRVALGDPKGGEVQTVGKCSHCLSPFDDFDPKYVCTVCRDPVLVCDVCRNKDRFQEWYCKDHMYLQGIYYTFIDRFTTADLKAQMQSLEKLHAAIESGRSHRNRRRTLKKQIDKVAQRIQMLKCQSVGESGKDAQAHPKHIPNPPCRTCNQRGCSGRCWGFWAGKNRPWKRRQADHELGCKEVGNKGSGLKTLSFQKDVRTDLKEESRRVANPPKRTKGTL